MSFIVLLGFLGYCLFGNWGVFGLKPTVLVVNSNSGIPQNQAPKLVNVKITNKNDVQEMYRILIRSPKLPRGPISCPNDNGISYQLNFQSKNKSINIGIEPTGCQVISIGKMTHKTFMGSKKANEFWNLLAKNLKLEVKKLYGYRQ